MTENPAAGLQHREDSGDMSVKDHGWNQTRRLDDSSRPLDAFSLTSWTDVLPKRCLNPTFTALRPKLTQLD